jgi:pimeloyl-ACP methyl ester carboxylesterase
MTLRQIGEYTEENTSRTLEAMGTTIHYHDVGEGEPILFLHSWGPGCTSWLTWHKILPTFAKHYRCIMMDLPNYAKTGPIVYEVKGSVHWFQAEMATVLLDHLGIERAHVVGNSQGGQTAMEFAYLYPDRINKLVWGDGHLNAGAGSYLISNLPEEGIRAGMEYSKDPTRERMQRFLQLNIEDQSLVTDELIDYCYHMDTDRRDLVDARNAIQPSKIPYPDNVNECKKIKAPTLMVWGRNDRTCTFELGIMSLNVIPDSRLVVLKDIGHWPPFEAPAEYAAHVLSFLKGYDTVLV